LAVLAKYMKLGISLIRNVLGTRFSCVMDFMVLGDKDIGECSTKRVLEAGFGHAVGYVLLLNTHAAAG
jgi:hypothetical protein